MLSESLAPARQSCTKSDVGGGIAAGTIQPQGFHSKQLGEAIWEGSKLSLINFDFRKS